MWGYTSLTSSQPAGLSSSTSEIARASARRSPPSRRSASEGSLKRASSVAADEILALSKKDNPYERTLIEITVARTLRSIMEGTIPV